MINPLALKDTVFALASAPGRSGVAVVRISGPRAGEAIRLLCAPAALPAPRQAVLRDLRDARTGELIDHALVLWFPSPHSFTGEDVVEFHIHGGRAVLAALIGALASLESFSPAEPGAFSRRAFENDKLDLTEAEAIADLVDAETAAQRRQALCQMDGALGALYRNWTERLKKRLAFLEAELDFADEDIPSEINAHRLEDLSRLIDEMAAHLDDNRRGERLRDGFMIALLGAPNAGKSSLLNALARREAAIVSALPGTTRDIVEVQLDLGGYPVTLADTAGLRESADAVENEGVRRALRRADEADLNLLLFDGSCGNGVDADTLALEDSRSLFVINKADALVAPRGTYLSVLAERAIGRDPLFLSVRTGEGLEELISRVIEEIETRYASGGSAPLTRARHRAALEEALAALRRAVKAPEAELCAEDVRLALRAIGRVTGRVDVEDILDIVFSEFCVGK